MIDFNVKPDKKFFKRLNCTAFITWNGPAEFKLLPYTAKSQPSEIEVESHEKKDEIVLSIHDVLGQMIHLDMFGSKPFYLSITPMLSKIDLNLLPTLIVISFNF